jgi:hypothetical protein
LYTCYYDVLLDDVVQCDRQRIRACLSQTPGCTLVLLSLMYVLPNSGDAYSSAGMNIHPTKNAQKPHNRQLITVHSSMSTLTFIPKTHPSPPTSPYNNSSLALTLTLVPNTQSYPTHHRNANQRHPSHTSHNRHRAQSKGLNHTQPSTFLFFFAKSAPYLQCHHQKAVLTSLLFLQKDGQD